MTSTDIGSLWKLVSQPGSAWLLSYLVHSTLLLAIVWAISRFSPVSRAVRDVLWKTALIGGMVTATVQVLGGVGPLAAAWTVGGRTATVPATAVIAPADGPGATEGTAPAPNPVRTFWEGARAGAAQGWPQLLLGAWVLGAALCGARLLGARRRLGRGGTPRREIAEGPVRDLLDHLCRASGVSSKVRLTVSRRIGSPVVLGNREICLPERALTELDREQQYTVLAHELAHIVRRDPGWRWISAAVEGIFFFQPLNRLARRRLLENAEFLADDWAVTRTGEGVTLARCLLEVAVWVRPFPAPVEALAMAERGTPLVRRVERLLSVNTVRRTGGRGAILAATALLALIVTVSPGFIPYRPLPAPVTPPSLESVVTPFPPLPASGSSVHPGHLVPPGHPLPAPGNAPAPARIASGVPGAGSGNPAASPEVPGREWVQRLRTMHRRLQQTHRELQSEIQKAMTVRQVLFLEVGPQARQIEVVVPRQRELEVLQIELDGLAREAAVRRDALRQAQDLLRDLLEDRNPAPVRIYWI